MKRLILASLCLMISLGCSSQVEERTVSVPHLPSQVQAKSNTIVEMKSGRILEVHPQRQVPGLTLPPIEMPRLRLPQYVLPESSAPAPPRKFHLPERAIEGPHFPLEPSWKTPEWNFEPDLPESEWAQIEPDQSHFFAPPNLKAELQLKPGATLRPRSPYCMPGHTSQNFVVTSMTDGLPLHPGVW